MLSKKQKIFIVISGVLALLCGLVAAVPFRAFPGLNKVDGILEIDVIVKLIAGAVALLLTVYPLLKKYSLLNKLRESSKVILIMVYFPILAYAIGAVLNVVYTLAFDYTSVGLAAPVSTKILSAIIATLVIYLVMAIYWIFSLHRILIKVDKFSNKLFDIFVYISILCILLLQFRVNSLYNEAFASFESYKLGTPFLFIIYIAIIIILTLGYKNLIKLIKKDETLIYYVAGEGLNDAINKVELNNAYNDTLDDFEQYFDENLDEYSKLEIAETELQKTIETQKEKIELVKIDSYQTNSYELEEENLVSEDSEELKELTNKKETLLKEIELRNTKLNEIRTRKNDLEESEEDLRNAKQTYEEELAEYNQYRVEFAGIPEEVEQPKKKEKKFTPTFEKMVEYAKSFSEKEGFKVNENAKGNLLKFYLGKKMYLVMQATSSDYRISFITSPEKFVKYVKENASTMSVPKNLSDNHWIKFTNKGKAEPKLVKELIKQAVQTAEKQLTDEKAEKEAAKKAKALAKKQEKAAQKVAEQDQE